ncbi:MAG: putative toxin-antitoxin system toxin component, PIN family [Chloroflexi bacterium]|nr:putative toxin-antitoxin system toxin component, PIN family [Chloroflexota bacterium]
MRIVVDTNIWVSGLLWQGKPWQLLKLVENGDIKLCIAYSMLLELEEVLAYERLQPRLHALQQTPGQLVAYALGLSTVYDISRTGPLIVNADPDDDIFVLCAVEAGAEYLVTGDKHLLNLGSYHGVKIVTVAEFLDQIL